MSYTNGLDKPEDYFNTVTYVANQTDNRQITVGFQPDFTWLKDRDQAVNHDLYDAVRGATKYISSNKTNSEATQTDGLKSFNSTGFTLGTGWGNQTTGDDYVSWNWLASNTTASNTDGSITSTVSASTVSGFSIVSYTGTFVNATIGHGLGSSPKMIIIKQRNNARNWVVGHDSIGWTKYLYLDSTQASNTGNLFNDTAPTNSVFSIVGGDSGVNASGGTYIAYCFAEKKGFSKFGSYTGNGSADGTFIYTGFKPAFIIVKKTNSTFNWIMYDNKRDELNPNTATLLPDDSASEYNIGRDIDFLSNGFKMRANYSGNNNSGDSYIYMCFAENPLVSSAGVPCTAR
jgi:hypothetical protein